MIMPSKYPKTKAITLSVDAVFWTSLVVENQSISSVNLWFFEAVNLGFILSY